MSDPSAAADWTITLGLVLQLLDRSLIKPLQRVVTFAQSQQIGNVHEAGRPSTDPVGIVLRILSPQE